MSEEKKQLTYADAGVDIDAGNKAVELMKDSVRATYRPEVIGDLGGFGGLFALNIANYKEPILVSGTDGVGTKLKLAFMADKHNTIGQDAVAMCVNDILVQGTVVVEKFVVCTKFLINLVHILLNDSRSSIVI